MDLNDRPDRMSDDQALQLWRAYQRTGDPVFRDRLVLSYAPMVRHVVYRRMHRVPAEMLESRGLEALIGAIDRYDPAEGQSMAQSAWERVQAAVNDALGAEPVAA